MEVSWYRRCVFGRKYRWGQTAAFPVPRSCQATLLAPGKQLGNLRNSSRTPRAVGSESLEGLQWEEVFEEEIRAEQAAVDFDVKGYCYGCGVEIQVDRPEDIGYMDKERYELKAKYKQYDQLLCERCISLSHGKMIPAVLDLHQQASSQSSRNLISPEEFRHKLMEVRNQAAVVVLLVDLLDLPGSFLKRVRDLVGKNPVVLIGTKFDLLPRKTSPQSILEYLRDLADARGLSVINSFLVSSRTGQGISQATSSILKNRRGRNVFVVGAANVGKSAFVRALLKEMRDFTSINFDLQARSLTKFLPMESSMPGTTLGIIPIKTFPKKGKLFDTPGLHIFHRVPHLLSPQEMSNLQPRRKLKPYIPPTLLSLTTMDSSSEDSNSSQDDSLETDFLFGRIDEPSVVSGCYHWGSLAKIEILEAPPSTTLVFYGPQALRVESQPLSMRTGKVAEEEEEEEVEDEADVTNIWGDFYVNEQETQDMKEDVSRKQDDLIPGLSEAFQDMIEEPSPPSPSSSPNPLNMDALQTSKGLSFAGDAMVEVEDPSSSSSPQSFGKESVALRGGLVIAREFEVLASGVSTGVGDVSISGLPGWCSILVPEGGGLVKGRVYVPRGVEAFLRPSIPVPNPLKVVKQQQF